jgi:hypothetical protein
MSKGQCKWGQRAHGDRLGVGKLLRVLEGIVKTRTLLWVRWKNIGWIWANKWLDLIYNVSLWLPWGRSTLEGKDGRKVYVGGLEKYSNLSSFILSLCEDWGKWFWAWILYNTNERKSKPDVIVCVNFAAVASLDQEPNFHTIIIWIPSFRASYSISDHTPDLVLEDSWTHFFPW